jgi:hypothetical protein
MIEGGSGKNEDVQNFMDDEDFGQVGVDLGAATTINHFGVGGPTIESLSRSLSGQDKNKNKPNGNGANRMAQSQANVDSQYLNTSGGAMKKQSLTNNAGLGASMNGRPIPSPTRMVIGGIPSNPSYKAKSGSQSGEHHHINGVDDEEQESFFIHPKNVDQFNDMENNHQIPNNRLF